MGGISFDGRVFEKNRWMGGGVPPALWVTLKPFVCWKRWKELMIMLVHSCI